MAAASREKQLPVVSGGSTEAETGKRSRSRQIVPRASVPASASSAVRAGAYRQKRTVAGT
eukprot:101014-Pleurochrysis_carterae.AAC.3